MGKIRLVFISLVLLPIMAFSTYCAAQNVQITGKVAAIGHAPFVKMALQGGTPRTLYVITGSLLEEIKNLQGVTLKVKGAVTGDDPRYQAKTLEISEYQIIAVGEGENRQIPWVGILTGDSTLQLQTESGKLIALEGPLVATLTAQRGSKVWLTGTIRSTGFCFWKSRVLNPSAFGVIRSK